ncbi:MAG: 2-oxo-4-hydroxy-4-carboxy-5-ureidoimidazoline decarboxylase [Opitutaceae bacterium]|jgi:2-oxo-4-hydroxy-4-carboxy-5-ureidoimidazoline decarboxylase
MISLAQLNVLDHAAFTAALGHLFEHSPWVANQTWSRRPFYSAAQLHAELCATMRSAAPALQIALIRAHPDLAGRLAQKNALTVESTREQVSAGLDCLTDAEIAEFQRLNTAYLERFGFPFIICARLNAKSAILEAMMARLLQTPEHEFITALAEIEKIAHLRLNDFLKTTL